jgi:hypothetical protein
MEAESTGSSFRFDSCHHVRVAPVEVHRCDLPLGEQRRVDGTVDSQDIGRAEFQDTCTWAIAPSRLGVEIRLYRVRGSHYYGCRHFSSIAAEAA